MWVLKLKLTDVPVLVFISCTPGYYSSYIWWVVAKADRRISSGELFLEGSILVVGSMSLFSNPTVSACSMNQPQLIERDHESLTIGWMKPVVDEVKFYELEMAKSDCGEEMANKESEWVPLSSSIKGHVCSIRKKNLLQGVSYRFRIRFQYISAKEAEPKWSDYSPPSDICTVLESDIELMAAPELAARDGVSVTIQWKEVTSGTESAEQAVKGYSLRFREEESLHWSNIEAAIKGNAVRKKGLTPGKVYYFSVKPEFEHDSASSWSYSPASAPCSIASLSRAISSLLPTQVLTKNLSKQSGGADSQQSAVMQVSAQAALAGKSVVALYFSAHWCGPCRQFTPMLLQLHRQARAAGRSFEVLFCSADHSESEFLSYYAGSAAAGGMGAEWPAVEFEDDSQAREHLMGQFQVSGIPRLCVLSGHTGRVIVDNAAAAGPLSMAHVDSWIQQSNSNS